MRKESVLVEANRTAPLRGREHERQLLQVIEGVPEGVWGQEAPVPFIILLFLIP